MPKLLLFLIISQPRHCIFPHILLSPPNPTDDCTSGFPTLEIRDIFIQDFVGKPGDCVPLHPKTRPGTVQKTCGGVFIFRQKAYLGRKKRLLKKS